MSDDLVKRIKERGDWLVDAVATSTQNRAFLRGEPECDDVACEAIRMNGEQAMKQIAKPLIDRIEELEAENRLLQDAIYIDDLTVSMQADDRTKALAAIGRALGFLNANMPAEAMAALRTTLAELVGGKDE